MKLSRLAGLRCWLLCANVLPAPACWRKNARIFLSIQRDVAQLQDQIKQLQTSQDQKMAALET